MNEPSEDPSTARAQPPDSPHIFFLDPQEGRPVNPNTPEGEIHNMAAFAAGVHAVDPWRRMMIKIFVWLVLIGIALGIVAGLVHGYRTF